MTQIFIDEENIEERYAQGLYEDYLKEKTEKLQSNWNSLREWLEKREKELDENYELEMSCREDRIILNKMNELEGVDNENNRFIK